MDSSTDLKPRRDTRRIALALIVAGLIVSFSVIGYLLYLDWSVPKAASSASIKIGDQVTLDYTGKLPDGRIFDTSLWYVAQDDALYPKSLTFTYRSNETYKPFSMVAGKYGAGGTIEGFAMGVVGLSVGDHRTIEIPPEKGYPVNPNQLVTIDVVQEVPATEVFTLGDFEAYYSTPPVALDQLQHFFWKWDVIVASVSDGFATVVSQPTIGSNVYPFGNPEINADTGWPVKVISYDASALDGAGMIKLQHMIGPNDVYLRKGTDADGQTFILWDYNTANGTFQIHRSDSNTGYNAEVSGRTLYFEITIISVEPEDYYQT
jgi:FKBP-type peptidyl-prolyl cis-trans isomerase 2